MTNDRPSLIVFADDWGRHASSCQHLVRRLLPRYPVVWVNTIGMRTPRLDRASLVRGIEKLRRWFVSRASTEGLPPNLRVVEPKMWPWFRRRHDRWLNRWLLVRCLRRELEGRPAVAVTTIPVVSDLIGRIPVSRWVYYCVDDFSIWPGLDQATIGKMERELAPRCARVIAVSQTLYAKLAAHGKPVDLLTHGVDVEFWRTAESGSPSSRLSGLERPLALFWGCIDQRMDVEFVRRLTSDLARGTVVFAGPVLNADPSLLSLPKVVHIPAVPLEELPHLAAGSDVLVMPYGDIPVNRAIQPLKLKEYLACGKPVVVRDLPANRQWADCADLVSSAEEFSRMVRQRASEGVPAEQRTARGRLSEEGWEAKARLFEKLALGPDAARNAHGT